MISQKILVHSAVVTSLMLGVVGFAKAQSNDPNTFVQEIADNTLKAFKANPEARNGNMQAINSILNQDLIPYTNYAKSTRLAVGQPWRQATDDQKQKLTEGFKKMLVRTYSGAFKNINDSTKIEVKPFRGDAKANDVVVRSTIYAANGPVAVDYRLEKNANSWKLYDLSVEGIWWIQNYRNQFASEISKGGIDGLINSLNKSAN